MIGIWKSAINSCKYRICLHPYAKNRRIASPSGLRFCSISKNTQSQQETAKKCHAKHRLTTQLILSKTYNPTTVGLQLLFSKFYRYPNSLFDCPAKKYADNPVYKTLPTKKEKESRKRKASVLAPASGEQQDASFTHRKNRRSNCRRDLCKLSLRHMEKHCNLVSEPLDECRIE